VNIQKHDSFIVISIEGLHNRTHMVLLMGVKPVLKCEGMVPFNDARVACSQHYAFIAQYAEGDGNVNQY
jgi:hypothetical protein